MLTNVRWPLLCLSLLHGGPAAAILLDCEKNPDGTYTCVELSRTEQGTLHAVDPEPAVAPAYLERAREECVYKEPRLRTGKMQSAAAKVEAEKAAQAKYQKCLKQKATELQRREAATAE